MKRQSLTLAKIALAWFAAGAGWNIQGRLIDHFLDHWVEGVAWLSWLVD